MAAHQFANSLWKRERHQLSVNFCRNPQGANGKFWQFAEIFADSAKIGDGLRGEKPLPIPLENS